MKLTESREIQNFSKPYIIAEIGANHNGDMQLAKKLIVAAKEAGADCVKFQSWGKNSIFAQKKFDDNYFLSDDYRNRTDTSLEAIVDAYKMTEEALLEMKTFADTIGIDFASTPFTHREVDFLLERIEAPFVKVASMDLNNYPFLEYIASKKKPIVLATGLSDLYEIDKAIDTIERKGNTKISILHCVSLYPPKDEEVNLNNIRTLQRLYPDYPIGFSDHTLGTAIPLASAALGACIIEKHFTLDKNMPGWDHKVSATPDELKIICEESKRISKSLGSFRIRSVEDSNRKTEFRRSIVLTRAVKKGEQIAAEDITYKRPGTGLAPEMRDCVVGRIAHRDLPFDHVIEKDDLV
jgi:N-acetylneuraminate synthase